MSANIHMLKADYLTFILKKKTIIKRDVSTVKSDIVSIYYFLPAVELYTLFVV